MFDDFPQKINLGMSEKQIASTFKKELIESGADYIQYMACASGFNGYNQIICNPTERVTKKGDILIIDTGATLNGYFSDFIFLILQSILLASTKLYSDKFF